MTRKDVDRLGGLRRFAVAITLFNILGHLLLGFEQSYAQPIIALLTAYTIEIILEVIESKEKKMEPRFWGSPGKFIDFLLPAHITGLAIAMLLYANDRFMPIVFATSVAIGSKAIFQAPVGNRMCHFFNPSNLGITITLLLFPWVGIAPPYHFTENLSGIGNWILPCVIIVSGSFLNAKFTRRIPLIITWLSCFFLQAFLRSYIFGTPLVPALLPMTGMAFILFTFYMVTDPATCPYHLKSQIFFGAAVAFTYGILMVTHIVFGLFFALSIVCTIRGIGLYLIALNKQWKSNSLLQPTTT